MSEMCDCGQTPVPHCPCDHEEPKTAGQGHPAFYAYADELHDRHRLKSGGYGTGTDPFANFSAIAAVSGRNRWDYPVERIIEKCTRIQSLSAQGRFDELREEFRDIGGLAGCCDAMLEDDHYQSPEGRGRKIVAEWRAEADAAREAELDAGQAKAVLLRDGKAGAFRVDV